MHIVGHKIFVRMKDIPMYLSKNTRDSIRNRYSHSVEVGLSTKYLVSSVSRKMGNGVDLDFMGVANIVGLVHDIGHTAYSHDGEKILDRVLAEVSKELDSTIRFNANLNNFRRIEKYGLFDLLPEDVQRYTVASLIKRKKELKEYPEYIRYLNYLDEAIELEERYLHSKGIEVHNQTGKTILCQAMDLADENRYRVTDIIDVLNIYSKQKLADILARTVSSKIRLKEIRKLVSFPVPNDDLPDTGKHSDKITVKELLIMLLEQESSAKTEFQNAMNRVSMAFNRNFALTAEGRLKAENIELEQLRDDFQKIAAKYIWGSKKVKNIKKPFNHYFKTVVDYFINRNYSIDFIDSATYSKALKELKRSGISNKHKRVEELRLMRNFLGGLTNPKIIELYKKIKIEECEKALGCSIAKKEKLIRKVSIEEFGKKLEKYADRISSR